MPQIKAVIFDLDGVLLDSRELIYRAFEHVLPLHGLAKPERAAINGVIGQPIEVMYSALAPTLDPTVLTEEHLAHHESHLQLLSAYAGAADLLTTLRKHGYKTGIFTGFNALANERLRQVGLNNLVDDVVDSTQYSKHKPDPEGLLLSMKKLNVQANEVVYVGDSPLDINAGKAAFVAVTVGITHGFNNRASLEAAAPDYCIDNLSQLDDLLAVPSLRYNSRDDT